MEIQWTDGARRNLDSIEAYIAEDNPRAAARTILRIVRRVQDQLTAHPSSGRLGRIDRTKELVFPGLPYIVVYMIESDVIFIVRVFHAAQKV